VKIALLCKVCGPRFLVKPLGQLILRGQSPRGVMIMIESGEQYRTTRAWVDRLRDSIGRLQAQTPPPGVHAQLHQAMIDAEITQLQDLVDDLAEYEEREHATARV
jgi:hypothetical protein